MGIAATLLDSIRAFLISSTVPMATGPINGDMGLGGKEGGVLTGLSDGDLTTGTMTGSFDAVPCGRMGAAGAGLTGNFSGALGPLSGSAPNGRITGANFLFVIPLGISLIVHFAGSLGSSVRVLSLSESISNESSVLSKIPVSLLGRSTFLYGVPGL